jgi:hypothetical protein
VSLGLFFPQQKESVLTTQNEPHSYKFITSNISYLLACFVRCEPYLQRKLSKLLVKELCVGQKMQSIF